MGIPNIQQQLYLKKALNENTDGMFDHPEAQIEESITEGLLNKIELAEGSIRASKIGKGKKFSPKMYDKYATKTAVRQLIKTGRDPNSIKFPLTRGLENYGFNVDAEDKRKAALKAKGLLREPKPLDPYTRAEARRIGDKVRNRQGKR